MHYLSSDKLEIDIEERKESWTAIDDKNPIRILHYRKTTSEISGVFSAPPGVNKFHVAATNVRKCPTGGSKLVFIWPQKSSHSRHMPNILVPLFRFLLGGLVILDIMHLWPGELLPSHLPSTLPPPLPPVKCNVIEPRSGASMIYPIFLALLYFIIFCVLLLLYIWLSDFLTLRQILGYINGPKCIPLIGLSWQIGKVLPEDRFRWFNDVCFDFDNGMVVTWFGIKPIVNIRKPRQIEIILRSYRYLSKAENYKIMLEPWLGNGLLTATDEMWDNHRRIIQPFFRDEIIATYETVINKNVKILNEVILTEVKNNPKQAINVFDLLNNCTFDITWEIATGREAFTQKKIKNQYVKSLTVLHRISAIRHLGSWMKWDAIFYWSKYGNKFLGTIRMMNAYTEEIIKQKLELREQQKLSKKNTKSKKEKINKPRAFIDNLIKFNEKNKEDKLSIQELRQELETFVFLGHITISSVVSWALFALGNCLKVQKKVHEELSKHLNNDKPATKDQIAQLTYLDMVVKEVLRMYPSIPTVGRCLDDNVVIDNYYIPKETTVNIQIYQLHHDPEVWQNPEVFDPDRFLPECEAERHSYAFIPFSFGARNCVATKFALLETKMILTAILRKWRVMSALKPSEIKMTSNYILKPYKDNLEVYFGPKDKI